MMRVLLDGFGASVVLRGSALALGLVVNVLLARALGPVEFGSYAFVLTIVTMLAVPLHSGIAVLTVREVARDVVESAWPRLRGLVLAGNLAVFAGTALAAVAVAATLALAGGRYDLGLWGAALVLTPLMGMSSLRDAALRGLQRPVLGQFPEVIVRPAALALGLFVFARGAGFDAAAAMVVHCGAAMLAFVVGTVALHRCLPAPVHAVAPSYRWRGWWAAAAPFTLLAVVQALNAAIPVLVMGGTGDDAAVGMFRIAELGASLVIVGLIAGDMVFAPKVVALHASGDKEALQSLVTAYTRTMVAFAAPVALLMVAFGDRVIDLLFGAEFAGARLPLTILALAQLANACTGPVGSLLNMAGHEKETLRAVVAAAVLNLMLCLALVPAFGVLGGAVAAALALVALNAYWSLRAWRVLGIRTLVS